LLTEIIIISSNFHSRSWL